MTIWIDADSCPSKIREIIAKAAERSSIPALFIANRSIPLNHNMYTDERIVEQEDSAADDYICDNSEYGDIAITRDILLAEKLVHKGLWVLNDRGDAFTSENIRQRVSERNFMKALKLAGTVPQQQSRFGKKEVKQFSDAFDRLLQKILS